MATKDEVKAAIEAEKAEVAAALKAQDDKIKELEDKVSQGNQVTPEDLEELRSMVAGIHTASPGTANPI